ncbi:hypothetical protein O181_015894 [Austropuccinia psidii MF-1]|uniref:Uncharacterized protein n=1 Tax=Austropuccinia psidii MF-1 TaxID=1389203 RepID=A0A9Q3C2U3_9BASI|nr:hypothetical protein [Austropuccinia psidii MF-1]
MGFKCQSKFSFCSLTHSSSCNHTDSSSSPIEKNSPNPAGNNSLIPHMPCKQTTQQTTPDASKVLASQVPLSENDSTRGLNLRSL